MRLEASGGNNRSALPLPLAGRLRGRVGVGVPHRNWMLLGRQLPAALYRARRPPPQAGEVKRIRGQTNSIKNHSALAGQSPLYRRPARAGVQQEALRIGSEGIPAFLAAEQIKPLF